MTYVFLAIGLSYAVMSAGALTKVLLHQRNLYVHICRWAARFGVARNPRTQHVFTLCVAISFHSARSSVFAVLAWGYFHLTGTTH